MVIFHSYVNVYQRVYSCFVMISPCEVVPSLEVRESVTLRVAGTKLEELEVGDRGVGPEDC